MIRNFVAVAFIFGFAIARAEVVESDVCAYGGTPGGVMAAIEAARMGKTAVLIEPANHVGGMTSGGLGWVDVGNPRSVGGLAHEYFHRVWEHYQKDDAWKWEKKHSMPGQHAKLPEGVETMWIPEPHVAEHLFDAMLKEAGVRVFTGERLDRANGVHKDGATIREIVMESGLVSRAKVFVDGTYEGDLLAAAGVSYTIGREANSKYGETLNGTRPPHPVSLATKPVDPYVTAGDPKSGLLPRVHADLGGTVGEEDKRVQAYCYRMCMTDVQENRVMIEKPAGYDERDYEIVFRGIEAGIPKDRFFKLSMLPNRKTDSNNHGSISTDFIGMSWDYAEADYATRKKIEAAHELWQRGLVWTLQNHPRVPADVKAYYRNWGLPKDEFTDTGHWPFQLYVREARRLVGDYVVTENVVLGRDKVGDPVGLASYTMDSHSMQYLVSSNGQLASEGGLGGRVKSPYSVSYRSLVPREMECANLLVPVCISATHAAYGSLRMEPVFMVLGQSAGAAAAIAIDDGMAVQKVVYAKLKGRLDAGKQVLEWKIPSRVVEEDGGGKNVSGVVVDDEVATLSGPWKSSSQAMPYFGLGYHHDGNESKGQCLATFKPELPADGTYDVYLMSSKNTNRATNVPVYITCAEPKTKVVVNQRSQGGWIKIFTGKFKAGARGWITVHTEDTDGFVVADAARWVLVPQKP